MIQTIEFIAFIIGIVFSILLAVFPRFGKGSRPLIALIFPAAISAGLHTAGLPQEDAYRLSFACILLAAAGGYWACRSLNGQARPALIISVYVLSALLIALLYILTPPYELGIEAPTGFLALGIAGYLSALYLLIVSVIVLATLEQILRGTTETARWALKFLFLGMGTFYAAIIYMSSQTLLYPRGGLLLTSSVHLLHVLFLCSCGLMAVSWKRGSGQSRIAISHGAIYSSITLLCVGVYLIASSIIARLASRLGDIGFPVEALVFLLSAILLAALLLGTGFRHRTKAWIRRNIFAGRYDYRQFWLEATERVKSIDPQETTAAALADIVHRAVGAIDIGVWTRLWNPNRLKLLSSQGAIPHTTGHEASGIAEQLLDVSEPLSLEDLNGKQNVEKVTGFMNDARASLLVPLQSSNRLVGVITVGADRSGRSYDQEAREFLRALAGHAAGEFHKSDLLATLVEAKEDEAFRTFSTFVLHDLKNFASTLSLIAQNAPRHQNNPDFQKDAFQSVFDTAEKMKRLCNSLRTFSSTLAANKKSADLNHIVRSVADTLNAGLQKYLKFELQELQRVVVDADEVARVVQNLLINAREAIAEDGAIIVRTSDLGDRVEVAVEDNGKGMSREFFAKELFLPFHTTKSAGLGIGLFQSKKIMEAHCGTIHVESEEGKGTKITLAFPV